jgi:tetratricopeptide (TPR) repeat protein
MRMEFLRAHWRPSALVLAALAAYANAFRGAFQFDDFNVIVRQGAVHSLAAGDLPGIGPSLSPRFVIGRRHLAFHWSTWRCSSECPEVGAPEDRRGPNPGAGFAAFAGALLFALHPANTEAVTYISGRSVSMMAFFYLASVLAYLRAGPKWLSPLLFAAGLATKEVAAALPVALLLCDALDLRRPFDLRMALRRQALHWLVLAAGIALMAAIPRYREMLETSLALRPFAEQAAMQVAALARHVGVLILAVPPNIDPELPAVPAVAGLAVLAAIAVGLALLRVQPAFAFALLWFFLHLAPTNSFLPRADAVNDRQLYLACIGPLALVGLAMTLAPRWRAALLVIAALLLGAATIARNQDYHTEVVLWSATVAESPGSARAFNNLGYAWQLEGRRDEARRAYERALQLDPGYLPARVNLRLLLP